MKIQCHCYGAWKQINWAAFACLPDVCHDIQIGGLLFVVKRSPWADCVIV